MKHPKLGNPIQYNRKEKDVNPINTSAISQTDEGIVRIRKGKVYFDLYRDDESKTRPFWQPVMVKDKYGNIVEMVRHSDAEDTMEDGVYISNQAIQDNPTIELKSRVSAYE